MKTIIRTSALIAAVLGIGLGPLSSLGLAQTPATLKAVTFQKDGEKLLVMVAVDGAFNPEFTLLSQPSRLVVDLKGVGKNLAEQFLQVEQTGILDIRTGQFEPRTARLVFDLGSPAPFYSFALAPDGLKIQFWQSGEEVTAPPVREKAPVQVRDETKTKPPQAVETSRKTAPLSDGFFAQLKGGLSLFLQGNQNAVPKQFALYGETATLNEAYSWNAGTTVDASVGKYVRAFGTHVKAGLGFSFSKSPGQGTLSLSLPHPLTFNTPRQVEFVQDDGLVSQTTNFYAFGLFPLLPGSKLSLWAGPMIGMATGKIVTIEDFEISETAPFSAADVAISGLTFIEEKTIEPLFGAIFNLEYRLNDAIALILDTKLVYINPKSANLGKRINFLQVQHLLGLQIRF